MSIWNWIGLIVVVLLGMSGGAYALRDVFWPLTIEFVGSEQTRTAYASPYNDSSILVEFSQPVRMSTLDLRILNDQGVQEFSDREPIDVSGGEWGLPMVAESIRLQLSRQILPGESFTVQVLEADSIFSTNLTEHGEVVHGARIPVIESFVCAPEVTACPSIGPFNITWSGLTEWFEVEYELASGRDALFDVLSRQNDQIPENGDVSHGVNIRSDARSYEMDQLRVRVYARQLPEEGSPRSANPLVDTRVQVEFVD